MANEWLQQLPQILGAVGGLRGGSNAFMARWKQLEAAEQQRQQQLADQERQAALLQIQRDQNTRAGQQQMVGAVNSFRTLLEDPSIEDPAVFDQRLAFARTMAPQLNVDAGFLDTLRPAPTVFEQREAKRKLAEIERQYAPQQLQMLEADDQTGAAPVFQMRDGRRLTLAQLRAIVGTQPVSQSGAPVSMRPPTTKPEVPNTPEERLADAIRRGDQAEVDVLTQAAETIAGARRKPEDPQMAELNRQIAAMRLENMRATKDTTGLPPRVQRQVDAQARGFDSQPITKKIQVMAEAVEFARTMSPTTNNPADDQALIYAFAKAMDPESVVREGEYATVQKYAQSWAQTFGFNVARVFSNTPFLTAQARANMKATIAQKYAAEKKQYDNVRQEYGRRISRMTGDPDGESYLIDYAAGFPSVDAGPAGPPPPATVAPPVRSGGAGPRGGVTNPFRMPHAQP